MQHQMFHLDDDVTIATRTERHKKGWRSDVDDNGHGFNIMITIIHNDELSWAWYYHGWYNHEYKIIIMMHHRWSQVQKFRMMMLLEKMNPIPNLFHLQSLWTNRDLFPHNIPPWPPSYCQFWPNRMSIL